MKPPLFLSACGHCPSLVRSLSFIFLLSFVGTAQCEEEPFGKKSLALLKRFRQEFVKISPGQGAFPKTFVMGSDEGPPEEAPAHQVEMKKEFWMAKYEVPQNLWQAVMGNNPSRWDGPRNSVEMLDYEDAVRFCEQATKMMRQAKLIDEKQLVRLPSEAEWEYCCRAGTKSVYSFGNASEDLGAYCWFTGNAAGNDPPVGAKKPNPWGLYDVHGYLWEWTADPWHKDHQQAPADGSPRTAQGPIKKRVLRGGSWKDKAAACTSTARRAGDIRLKDSAVGLRCVLSKISTKSD